MSSNAGPSVQPTTAKRKSRSTRGLQNKVNALEEQMEQVKVNLENVVSLLLRLAPTANQGGLSVTPDSNRHQDSITPSSHQFTSQPPLPENAKSSTTPNVSLEQWVQQISGTIPSTSFHNYNTNHQSENGVRESEKNLKVIEEEEGSEGSSSDGEGDEKEQREGEGIEGMSMMREMLRREERRRLRADGHTPTEPLSPKDNISIIHHQQHHQKKNSFGYDAHTQEPINGPKKRKRSHHEHNQSHSVTPSSKLSDPIVDGICTEAHGKGLFDLFFRGAHAFIPVFDPSMDTWESLRRRSPFSISAILFVGQKILDAGHEASELQKQLKDYAEKIGKTTLFSPIANAEALQAMIVLASWGDTGWRPGSHAVSMGYDMELYKCLPKLAEHQRVLSSVGSSDNRVKEAEQRMVIGARLWLLVCKMAIEMAYNHGRPLIIDEALILPHSHALMNHPSRLPTDGRIIASCELLLHRLPLHKISISSDRRDVDQALQRFNDGALSWEAKWREYYIQQGFSEDNILITDLTTQRCFSSVLANSYLLRDIRSPHDVENLPTHRKRWLLSSLDDARFISSRILSTEKSKLLYANHYSHVALASVSRIYIRLATLFPEAVDLRKVAKDLTQLTDVLAHFPGVSFARQLRYVISKARKKRILPPETRPTSPTKPSSNQVQWNNSNPSEAYNNIIQPQPQTSQVSPQTFDIHGLFNGNNNGGDNVLHESPMEFDPFLAEELFNQNIFGTNPNHVTQTFNSDQIFGEVAGNSWIVDGNIGGLWFENDPSMNSVNDLGISSWLDFPALGESPSFLLLYKGYKIADTMNLLRSWTIR
ncbi:uncharacterized protein L201_008065 [Kwoniella dendrophila CBS 6074]|uniref:Transcription factor domain-containing protein n=1 Tax=Kwoniella dendrophila CBS 6074 TaxID=1295534 RepID=A0AAX4K699_9TREE